MIVTQRVYTVSGDVSDKSIADKLLESVSRNVTSIHVLINCAGITHTAPMVLTPADKYEVRGANTELYMYEFCWELKLSFLTAHNLSLE